MGIHFTGPEKEILAKTGMKPAEIEALEAERCQAAVDDVKHDIARLGDTEEAARLREADDRQRGQIVARCCGIALDDTDGIRQRMAQIEREHLLKYTTPEELDRKNLEAEAAKLGLDMANGDDRLTLYRHLGFDNARIVKEEKERFARMEEYAKWLNRTPPTAAAS